MMPATIDADEIPSDARIASRVAEIPLDPRDGPRAADTGIQAEHGHRRTGSRDLLADRSCFVDAAHERLEALRQMPHEIQHHFLGAADHECVRDIDDADRTGS